MVLNYSNGLLWLFIPGRQQRQRIEALLRPNSIVYAKKGGRFPNLRNKKSLARTHDRDLDDANAMLQYYSSKSDVQKQLMECDERQRPRVYNWETLHILPSVKPHLRQTSHLLRRPARINSKNIVSDQDVAKMARVYKGFEIGLMGARTLRFYQDNFPLLANMSTREQLEAPTYRELVEELEKKYVHKKRRQMLYRMIRLNSRLYHLERQSSGEFESILRDQEYNPRRWSINEFKYP